MLYIQVRVGKWLLRAKEGAPLDTYLLLAPLFYFGLTISSVPPQLKMHLFCYNICTYVKIEQ